METLGTPQKEKIQSIPDPFIQEKLKDVVNMFGNLNPIPFEKIVRGLSADGYDLLKKLLELDYTKRITAE